MSQTENQPFDAADFTRRLNESTAARRKEMSRKPGGDTVQIVAVCRYMLGVNKPEWEPWLSNIEGLVAAYDAQATALAAAEARAAEAEARAIRLRGVIAARGLNYAEAYAEMEARAQKAEGRVATILQGIAEDLGYLQDICGAVSDSDMMEEISASADRLGVKLIFPAPAAPVAGSSAGQPEPWRAVFDNQEDYDASVVSVVARIASGEIQPREPDEEGGQP